ncbi:MAG: hypothetical protein WC604_04180 [Candidatus Gracilibacteria bacterium]
MRVIAVITIATVGAFVAKFAICAPETVRARGVFYEQKAIIAVFVAVCGSDHVTVFVAVREVAVIGVFGFVVDKWWTRDFELEFVKLVEEWFVVIWVLSVVESIPYIAPPFVAGVNFVWAIRAKTRDYFFVRKVAFAVVETVFVAVCKAADRAAGRAKRRGRDFVELACECWRESFVKFFVSVCDSEEVGTIFALFLLHSLKITPS